MSLSIMFIKVIEQIAVTDGTSYEKFYCVIEISITKSLV